MGTYTDPDTGKRFEAYTRTFSNTALTLAFAGRFNDSDLRSGEPRRLYLASPPVLGGGLCSTHRVRAIILLLVRLLGLALILVSNIAIKGASPPVPRQANVTLVVPRSVSDLTAEDVQESVLLRTGCTGTINDTMRLEDGPETVVYYGEIRNDECLVDRNVVYEKAVKFSQRIIFENMTTGNCTRYNRVDIKRKTGNISTAQYWCEHARIQCGFEATDTDRVNLDTCRGFVHKDGIVYMTDEGAAWPLMPSEGTEARMISGYNWQDDRWFNVSIVQKETHSIEDAINAIYGAGNETTLVRTLNPEQITVVRPTWFLALALKILLVLLLFAVNTTLKRKGYQPVAHDEQRLTQLIRRRLEENDPRLTIHNGRDNTPSIFINAQRDESSGLLVYAAGRPGATPTTPGVSGNVQQKDANYDRHAEEAMFY